ncbi:hypothetical protein DES49_0923 [Halospina denitrificans]|uniref:MFS transporter permease n=1 Tax=Halospina denitrificans TaxID=332522 RepID=A0A4R7JZW7_9GAMM|nr:DUF6064 family protein [Halospina denitrificans]TDT43113.1 hypothetical protein DES49_0923 [Halospina denitrificans]
MLGELDTYTVSQFIPMTPEVYFRLFERLNEAVWPWQVPVFAAAVIAPFLLWRGRGLSAAVLMALCWFWVAAVFQFYFHAELNWAGPYFGWAFVLQGLLVLIAGARGRLPGTSGVRAMIGAGLMGFALVLYPLLGPLTGRSWAGLELAGTAPDPTAMLTLGLLLVPVRVPWLLVPIPVIWCLYSGATWWALGWAPGLVNIVAVLIFLLSLPFRNR